MKLVKCMAQYVTHLHPNPSLMTAWRATLYPTSITNMPQYRTLDLVYCGSFINMSISSDSVCHDSIDRDYALVHRGRPLFFFFFLNDPAPPEISPLPQPAPLPIYPGESDHEATLPPGRLAPPQPPRRRR